jgi:hypothetical protein
MLHEAAADESDFTSRVVELRSFAQKNTVTVEHDCALCALRYANLFF